MPRATTREIGTDRSAASTDHLHHVVEEAGRVLDDYRGKIDALTVQLDRADVEVREDLRTRVGSTRSAYRARTHLTDVRRHSHSSLETLRQGLETVMADLRLACASAEAAVRRNPNR